MGDLLVGLGLLLVAEGLVWAMSPGFALRILATAAATPPETLRIVGAGSVAAGMLLVWLVRG